MPIVVCYQLWESIKGKAACPIAAEDLVAIGDVDEALAQFYREALNAVLAQPGIRVSERQLRAWFDRELITEGGIRGIVHQAKAHKSGIPDAVLQSLQDRYLLTTELRAGGTWFELTHDRLVVPIRADNRAWFEEHMSTLQRQAALWDKERRPDRTARLWDATTGRQRLHFAGRSGPVSWAAFSPDGASIITAGADRTACIWDAGVGQVTLQLTGHWSRAYAAAYSPDGRRVVTASDDGTARIWNAQTGRKELRLTSSVGALSAAAFSPDGTHVAASSYDGVARIWPATPEGLLSLAESRIQQDSLRLMPEERLRYELD